MLGLSKLASAVRTLADNLTNLAATVAEVNAHVRGRLALDQGEEPPALEGRATPPARAGPEEPEAANGRSRRKKAAAE